MPYASQDILQMGPHLGTPTRHRLLGQSMLKMQAPPHVHVSLLSAPASTASLTCQEQAYDTSAGQYSVHFEENGAWQTAWRTEVSHDVLAS